MAGTIVGKLVNGDAWRRLVAALLVTAGGAIGLLWQSQGHMSERIARLEEYREAGPASLATDVQLQEQRLTMAEASIGVLRETMSEIKSDLRAIVRTLEDVREGQRNGTISSQ